MAIRLRGGSQPSTSEEPHDPVPHVSGPAAPEVIGTADSVATADASPSPPFLSLREAADWLCVSHSTLLRLVAKGELSAVWVGKRRKIPASCLSAYVARDILLPNQVIDTDGIS